MADNDYTRPIRVNPVKSTASVIAIIAAIASFILSARGSEVWGILAAFVAFVAGLIGFVKAASPRVSGGVLSLSAIGLSVLAVIFAFIALIIF